MLSSNFPAAAVARVAAQAKTERSDQKSTAVRTTVESFTCTKKTTEESSASDNVEKSVLTPKKLVPVFDANVGCSPHDPPSSQATTCVWSPQRFYTQDIPKAKPIDVEVSFIKPPPEADVIDLSDVGSPFDTDKIEVKIEDDVKCQPKTHTWCVGNMGSSPTALSCKSPPKKKSDACPSDEKLFGRKVVQSDIPIEKVASPEVNQDKENDSKLGEHESFVAAAPYACFSNSEVTAKNSSHAIMWRKDKGRTSATAHDACQDRKSKPKKAVLQTVVAPDTLNEVSCKKPVGKEKAKAEKAVKEEDDIPPTNWKLCKRACKNGDAFWKAVETKVGGVAATRAGNAATAATRAVVHGDILVDSRLGSFDPESAKSCIDSF